MAHDEPNADKQEYRCYMLNGLPYLPHYQNRGLFVAPGGSTVHETYLKELGATSTEKFLWKRAY